MRTITLSEEEASVLARVLSTVALRDRTGEIGVLHGLDRFVSTNVTFTKKERELLSVASGKLGARVVTTTK